MSVFRATCSTRRESSAGSTRLPSGFSAMFAVATSRPSLRRRTAAVPASRSPGKCSARARHRSDRRLVSTGGTRVAVEISAVPLMNGERVVGVFGLIEGRPDDTATAPDPRLTPRQVEVLRLLEQGRSTKQIAAELHLSTETVRNHVRRLFRVLGVNSRLEAVAVSSGYTTHVRTIDPVGSLTARRGAGTVLHEWQISNLFSATTRRARESGASPTPSGSRRRSSGSPAKSASQHCRPS